MRKQSGWVGGLSGRSQNFCIARRKGEATTPLLVFGLVELDFHIAGGTEARNKAIVAFHDVRGEFDAARFELGDGLVNVVAVEGKFVPNIIGGMAADFVLGQV